MEVIDPGYCLDGLNQISENFEVTPKVLCVAYNHTHQTKFYVKEDSKNGGYKEIAYKPELNKLIGRKYNWYIAGTGNENKRNKSKRSITE